MRGDPSKCIQSFHIETDNNEIRLVVTLTNGLAVVMAKDGLTMEQARTFSHGMEAALKWATPDHMEKLLAGEAMMMKDPCSTAIHFNEGMREGLDAAARGYWLSPGVASCPLDH